VHQLWSESLKKRRREGDDTSGGTPARTGSGIHFRGLYEKGDRGDRRDKPMRRIKDLTVNGRKTERFVMHVVNTGTGTTSMLVQADAARPAGRLPRKTAGDLGFHAPANGWGAGGGVDRASGASIQPKAESRSTIQNRGSTCRPGQGVGLKKDFNLAATKEKNRRGNGLQRGQTRTRTGRNAHDVAGQNTSQLGWAWQRWRGSRRRGEMRARAGLHGGVD